MDTEAVLAMTINKFNARWQITRLRAKQIKDPIAKAEYIRRYLAGSLTVCDVGRVANWARMTVLGYKDNELAVKALRLLSNDIARLKLEDLPSDNGSLISDLTSDEIAELLKDLSKRKYNFQFNRTPKAHIAFVKELERELQQH